VLQRGWLSSNNIVLIGQDHTAVVDSGYVAHENQTLDLVRSNLNGRTLDTLVNTHLHSDHCGGNRILQSTFHTMATLVPAPSVEAVQQWDTARLTFTATGQSCDRFDCTGALTPGHALRLGDWEWQVFAAPGHDPESVILFQPEFQCLISADALWENGFGVVFPELEGVEGFEAVATTLDLIESLKPKTVVPGHGGPFTQVDHSLSIARSRLEAFEHDAARHAKHAVKVLLKFKLMEVQQENIDQFVAWAVQSRLVSETVSRYFPLQTPDQYVRQMLQELAHSKILSLADGVVSDLA
jgi:glyoxylase-like metal-dependent hydrolase (beta-lactamase superfamily II)